MGSRPPRTCLECGSPTPSQGSRCTLHTRLWHARRNASPIRKGLYGGQWAVESRSIRMGATCRVCDTTLDLTVDHPTRWVLCRSHHSQLEARRRREDRESSTR